MYFISRYIYDKSNSKEYSWIFQFLFFFYLNRMMALKISSNRYIIVWYYSYAVFFFLLNNYEFELKKKRNILFQLFDIEWKFSILKRFFLAQLNFERENVFQHHQKMTNFTFILIIRSQLPKYNDFTHFWHFIEKRKKNINEFPKLCFSNFFISVSEKERNCLSFIEGSDKHMFVT